MAKSRIGFIGLGLMGAAIVNRLQSKNYDLTVLANRSRTAIDEAISKGAVEAKTAKELAENSDIIMICVDTSASVESRMMGDEGVIAGLSQNKVVIDFGTSLPQSTKKLGALAEGKGAIMLDAPLGRTPAHAIEGKLNLMTAGDKPTFDRIKPVLDDIGENVFHLGALGSGHTIKLINNFFGMTTASAMAEAFVMADKAGVDRKMVYDVISAGPLHSAMMDFIKGFAVDNNPKSIEFSIGNAAKDVGYYSQMADDLGVDSIMSKSAHTALSNAKDDGFHDNMVAEMVSFFTKKYS